MQRHILIGMVSVFTLLTACGGSSSKDSTTVISSTPSTESTVDAKITGALITPASASNLIDGDLSTSVMVDSSAGVLIDFKSVYNVKEFTLSRLESSASFGTNPDILVELSTDGISFQKSKVSLIVGGEPCFSIRNSKTAMQCNMSPPQAIRYVRISVKEGFAFDFTEFEAIAAGSKTK